MQSQYPEHDKLKKVKEQSQWLGEFLDWSQSNDEIMCKWDEQLEEYRPLRENIQTTLSRYLNINLNKLEQEKEAMLQSIRELQEDKHNWIQPRVVVWYTNGMLMATSGVVNSIMEDGRVNIDVISGTVILPKKKCYKTEQEADKR